MILSTFNQHTQYDYYRIDCELCNLPSDILRIGRRKWINNDNDDGTYTGLTNWISINSIVIESQLCVELFLLACWLLSTLIEMMMTFSKSYHKPKRRFTREPFGVHTNKVYRLKCTKSSSEKPHLQHIMHALIYIN